MFEFHTNFIPSGTHDTADGMYPNHHQFHETLEITPRLDALFRDRALHRNRAVRAGRRREIHGLAHPAALSPAGFGAVPFKVSVSLEYAFNQPGFDPNRQTLEIRPIFERQRGRLYLSINPDLSVAVKGPDAGSAPGFEPNAKIGWDWTKQISAGLEYYAETGPVKHFDPLGEQHHLLFPALDLNVSPDWEFNFGVGHGFTSTSEHWIVKAIVGRRFKL